MVIKRSSTVPPPRAQPSGKVGGPVPHGSGATVYDDDYTANKCQCDMWKDQCNPYLILSFHE